MRIGFVAYKNFDHIVDCMHFDLFYPILDVVETGAIVDSVGKDDAHGSSIVGLGDGFEAFLPGGIPNL